MESLGATQIFDFNVEGISDKVGVTKHLLVGNLKLNIELPSYTPAFYMSIPIPTPPAATFFVTLLSQ